MLYLLPCNLAFHYHNKFMMLIWNKLEQINNMSHSLCPFLTIILVHGLFCCVLCCMGMLQSHREKECTCTESLKKKKVSYGLKNNNKYAKDSNKCTKFQPNFAPKFAPNFSSCNKDQTNGKKMFWSLNKESGHILKNSCGYISRSMQWVFRMNLPVLRERWIVTVKRTTRP